MRLTVISVVCLVVGCAENVSRDGGDPRPVGDPQSGDQTGNGDPAPAGDDSPGLTETAAVPGSWCPYHERVGLVWITDEGSLTAGAELFAEPDPLAAAPDLSDASCVFYDRGLNSGCGCTGYDLCGDDGSCHASPEQDQELRLRLISATGEQTLVYDNNANLVWGAIELAETEFSLELVGSGQRIIHPISSVPDGLADLSGTLSGPYSAPTAVDISWTAFASDTYVFTHVPKNHHVNDGSFTECHAASDAGAMHIDGGFLVPLSVSTGLEFQGVDQIRFAAAHTPIGCIEFRWLHHHYVSLY